MVKRLFAWWTGDRDNKSWGIAYGDWKWPSRCEWYVPGTWLAIILGALITLHSPSGRELFVNGDEIMVIRGDTSAWDWQRGCHAEVTVHDKVLCVKEHPNEVKALVEGTKQ